MNDGLSRVNRVRYDTPSFSGFSVAASFGQGGATELGVKYKGTLAGTKIDARGFFADGDDFAADAEIAGFSASAVHSCLLYTSQSPRDQRGSRMPSSA